MHQGVQLDLKSVLRITMIQPPLVKEAAFLLLQLSIGYAQHLPAIKHCLIGGALIIIPMYQLRVKGGFDGYACSTF